jgi:hypothetical protein
VLGLLALPFGILAPFAIWSGARSLRRALSWPAALGLAGGIAGAAFLIAGLVFWLATS